MTAVQSAGSLPSASRGAAWFRGIILLATLATFLLIVIGGIVRVTGSGLGCPDWPLCHGSVIPPLEMTAIIEYTHRFVASVLVGPLVFAATVLAWTVHRRQRWIVIPATLAFVLLIAQSALGGATVLTELHGGVRLVHLALSQAFLACLIFIAVVAFRGPLRRPRRAAEPKAARFPRLMIYAAAGVYLLLLSGALVTATGATATCLAWPACNGWTVFPEGQLPAIHMGHRYAALLAGLLLLYALHLGFRTKSHPPAVRRLSLLGVTLFMAQIVAGALNIWLHFPPFLVALHVALASAVWANIIALTFVTFAPAAGDNGGQEPAHA